MWLSHAGSWSNRSAGVRGAATGLERTAALCGLFRGALGRLRRRRRVLASITGPLVLWHWGDFRLALSVSVSVLAASSTATGAAMALPWVLDSLKLDPAFGSGPLATVIQDLLSIWIYLSVTALVM